MANLISNPALWLERRGTGAEQAVSTWNGTAYDVEGLGEFPNPESYTLTLATVAVAKDNVTFNGSFSSGHRFTGTIVIKVNGVQKAAGEWVWTGSGPLPDAKLLSVSLAAADTVEISISFHNDDGCGYPGSALITPASAPSGGFWTDFVGCAEVA